ncbi:ImmA/IrrE family metallo-endopeptidase [Agarilytica rhodophyticola]|uniref:ImmA/IrrE family metallo-endopeptidase n=1 Tax=Agarilytica rhodophyticola TaxID=1737490 RepID=UPI000B349931|nr:ImmA/IrrE family metallo-endopeptidase [Agarilytica rhodophyticola]
MEKIRAIQISSKALKVRKTFLGAAAHQPICPYALCEAMGFELKFVRIPSFEGMYVANQNLVLISAERPEGRKRFTCAHEIGHHVLGHGTAIDEMLEDGSDKQEEQEADFFASMLLMPSSAVNLTLKRYGVEAENITPKDAYILSKYFGVSYRGFIGHITYNLRIITYKHYQSLKNAKLPDIRYEIIGQKTKNQIFFVDQWWDDKAIELEVGDFIVSKKSLAVDGPNIIELALSDTFNIYTAVAPGITRLFNDNWSCFAKVSRLKFHGFYQYKYDEDEE